MQIMNNTAPPGPREVRRGKIPWEHEWADAVDKQAKMWASDKEIDNSWVDDLVVYVLDKHESDFWKEWWRWNDQWLLIKNDAWFDVNYEAWFEVLDQDHERDQSHSVFALLNDCWTHVHRYGGQQSAGPVTEQMIAQANPYIISRRAIFLSWKMTNFT